MDKHLVFDKQESDFPMCVLVFMLLCLEIQKDQTDQAC